MDKYGLQTKLIHAGDPQPRIAGAVGVPIFQSTVFELVEGADYHDIRYPRLNNLPNHDALGKKLAAIEGGEAALVTSSGMAAISATLLALLAPGGHLLLLRGVYGGTHTFADGSFKRLGLSYDLIDGDAADSWNTKLRQETKAIYVEAMTNPLLDVPDHRAVIAFARAHGLTAIIDNTFATPVNFRPIELGYDVVLHSGTKYLNGHSDLVAGAVIASSPCIRAIKHDLDHLGGCLDPHACFLLARGLKTLALRVRAQNGSALALATALEAHRSVAKVRYPGLASHPQHARARDLFGGCGGMLSFELHGGAAAAKALIERLVLPVHGPSLGGPETLITRPARSSHAGLTAKERDELGIGDGLLRVSVGLEESADLLADFGAALDALDH